MEGDVSMRQLVLNDRDPSHKGVDAGRLLRREIVGRSRDQFRIARDDQRVLELAEIIRRHLRGRLDELSSLEQRLKRAGIRRFHPALIL